MLHLAAPEYLFISFMHTHFMYGIIFWGAVAKLDFESFVILQKKKTVRMVTRSPRYAHADPIFANNGILKL